MNKLKTAGRPAVVVGFFVVALQSMPILAANDYRTIFDIPAEHPAPLYKSSKASPALTPFYLLPASRAVASSYSPETIHPGKNRIPPIKPFVDQLSNVFHGGFLSAAAITSLNAIQVPATAWLFGGGIVGLVAIRRRSK